jgi:phospholipid/cholesterol/gamma-HCH transport system substrate-binding protein
MILTRTVKRQLVGLSIAFVLGSVVLGMVYLRVPEAIGYQRYGVTAAFVRGAQLYDGAEVTYRGHPIGKVTEMEIADEGILVTLSLREEVGVPADVRAEIHSRSAVGEQYVDLVPVETSARADTLADGDHIPVKRTTTPVEIGPLLDNVGALVDSLPADDLNALLAEVDTALRGREQDLQTLIDSGGRLVDTAEENLGPTQALLTDFEPLAGAVNTHATELDRATRNLALLTATLRAGDGNLRTLLSGTPDLAEETTLLLKQLDAPLRGLLANLGVFSEQLATYQEPLRDILSTYPRVTAMIQSITLPFEDTHQIALDLANLNDPSACLDGFLPPDQWRDPSDQSTTGTPQVYCDVAQDDPRVVKGAHNLPCVRYPGVTGPTPELCRERAGQ